MGHAGALHEISKACIALWGRTAKIFIHIFATGMLQVTGLHTEQGSGGLNASALCAQPDR